MNIAVATPSGHVGSAVADFLLDFGDDIHVKLLSRRPSRVKHLLDRGASLVTGSQDDVNFLSRATEDVDALFWATPPGYGSDDVRAFQNRQGRAAATAVRVNRIRRVVNLSSIWAEMSTGAGPVGGLHDVEARLDDAAENVTHLRAGLFFENLLWQVDSLRELGKIRLPVSPARRLPMIATRDIGRVAAARLASQDWSGRIIHELYGPADLSFRDVADIISQESGRKVVFASCDLEEFRQLLLNNAMSENAAALMVELYSSLEADRLQTAEQPTAKTSTSTTLREFAQETLLPLITETISPMWDNF
jgi:uncharacterized protein YbjT (DUF2867 family)